MNWCHLVEMPFGCGGNGSECAHTFVYIHPKMNVPVEWRWRCQCVAFQISMRFSMEWMITLNHKALHTYTHSVVAVLILSRPQNSSWKKPIFDDWTNVLPRKCHHSSHYFELNATVWQTVHQNHICMFLIQRESKIHTFCRCFSYFIIYARFERWNLHKHKLKLTPFPQKTLNKIIILITIWVFVNYSLLNQAQSRDIFKWMSILVTALHICCRF